MVCSSHVITNGNAIITTKTATKAQRPDWIP